MTNETITHMTIHTRMRGSVSCKTRDCFYCDCGESRWAAQERAEDNHPLAEFLSKQHQDSDPPSATA